MSEMSEKARSEGKEKVKRLTEGGKGAVDASGWTEDEYGCGLMHQEKKLGNRPISKQNLACGGKAAHKHSGRKSRDMGGPMSNAGQNLVAQVPAPPQNRFSFTGQQSPFLAAAGMNKGGSAKQVRARGGGLGQYSTAEGQKRLMAESVGHQYIPPSRVNTQKAGDYGSDPMGNGKHRMVPSGDVVDESERKSRLGRKNGGMAEEIEGKRPVSGRMPRASGGATKKGTTVNIIIAQKPEPQPAPGGTPPGAMMPKPPMPMPAPGAPAPMGAPAGPMPGGPNMPPPSMQPHAKGGSVYPDMKYSAANAKGRMEKARKYGA